MAARMQGDSRAMARPLATLNDCSFGGMVDFVAEGSYTLEQIARQDPLSLLPQGSRVACGGLGSAACRIKSTTANRHSPTGVAEHGALGPSVASSSSQPNSATSSLVSRQSSGTDLATVCGLADRCALLAALAVPPPGRGLPVEEASCSGGCTPVLVAAVCSFDGTMMRGLSPIKTRSCASTEQQAPTPPAYADSLVSPLEAGMRVRTAPGAASTRSGCGPVHIRSSSTSMGAPTAYNPYDRVAAVFQAPEFAGPNTRSAASSTNHTPSVWSAGSRGSAAAAAMQPAEEDEMDVYVSVPGMRCHSMPQMVRPPELATAGLPASQHASHLRQGELLDQSGDGLQLRGLFKTLASAQR